MKKRNMDALFIYKELNSKIRYIFPWIWSLIMKLLMIQNPELKRFKLLPYYIKYGLNSEDKFINYIYKSLKNIVIQERPISLSLNRLTKQISEVSPI